MKLINLELLVADDLKLGDGTEQNPHRHILRTQTLDGTTVFEYDVALDKVSMTGNLIKVIQDAPRVINQES